MKALDYMIKEGLYEYSTDTWGGDDRTEDYYSVMESKGQVNYKDEVFVITHTDGGGAGMGAYPPTASILRIKPVVEPIKVVIIESEAGWGQRVDEVKEFDTMKEAEDYVTEFNKDNNAPVTPSWYMYAYIDKDD